MLTARALFRWVIGVSIGFVFFTVGVQLIAGYATNTNFVTMDWDGSIIFGGLLALIFGTYDSLEA